MMFKRLLYSFLFLVGFSFASKAYIVLPFASELDTIPVKERFGDFLNAKKNPFDLKDPSFIQKSVEYDPKSGNYFITEKIGEEYFRTPTAMSFNEYLKFREGEQERTQFLKMNGVGSAIGKKSLNGVGLKADDPLKRLQEQIEKNIVDRLFGGNEVSIIPQGSIDIPLGFSRDVQRNPQLAVANQVRYTPIFDMKIQMSVTGKIGEKMNLTTNYNSGTSFNFDNQIKLNYDTPGFSEDEIVKDIGAGNVSLPLKSTLIQGASSLFGLKLGLQFGNLKITTVAAEQQSRRQQIKVQQGSQKYRFAIGADQYDENRHFFFTHSNRENYEAALTNLPQINSLFAITYLEVWVTNDRTETQNVRDIVAFTDLGEPERIINKNVKKKYCDPDINGKCLPSNDANTLLDKLLANDKVRNFDGIVRELTARGGDFEMQQTKDFEKVRARKLRPDEYSFDPKLGYISCNFQLRPNQVLGVAFTYKYNGKEYKVGELSNNSPSNEVKKNAADPKKTDTIPQMLFVKLLKGTTPRLDIPLWDLMMKNVYSLGANSVNKDGFRLDIMYVKPGDGDRRFLPDTKLKGLPLLTVFNLDKLNTQGDPQPDGVFDFVEGVTVNTRQGKIIFPVLEPFGKTLAKKIDDPALARSYVYQQLYDTTITAAREFAELNVFYLKGEYKGTSNSEYQLGTFNLPKGSVKVTAGGQTLVEGSDYEVNYGIGTVKILNEAYVNSTVPVNISFEDNQLFGFDQRRVFGTRWDYTFNKHLAIGGTFMKLWQVPFTQKVNVGEDPVSNNVYGLDINYSKDAPWLTKLVDKLPFYSTKVPSSISFTAEGAYLDPGIARSIRKVKNPQTKEVLDQGGVVYVDDFEGSTNGTDLRQPLQWVMSSVPQNDAENNNPLFRESELINSTISNANRAKLMWYSINEQGGSGLSSSSSVRSATDETNPNFGFITDQEVFPKKEYGNTYSGTFASRMFDLTFLPSERGPYNFDLPEPGYPGYTKGLDVNGRLNNPETRWAGIMRALPYNDFEASNVEFIDLWVLSPFLKDDQTRFNKGKLHIDLGNISEDIIRDSRQFYENGLPGGIKNSITSKLPTDETNLARVPRITPITNAFEQSSIKDQDVGLDGFGDGAEKSHFKSYLGKISTSNLVQAAKDKINDDPSNDNFTYFLDSKFNNNGAGVLDRYRNFNGTEGNSQPAQQGLGVSSSTNFPDSEDLDNNKSLDNEGESYFHYEVPIEFSGVTGANPGGLNIEKAGFVADIIKVDSRVKARWNQMDQNAEPVFYRIRIPIDQFKKKVGGIQDFRSIRFMRVYMTGFTQPITLRFAKFELARSQWRRYKRSPYVGADVPIDPGTDPAKDNTAFDVNSVNFEENGNRPGFKYVLPPGIQREVILGQLQSQQQNEQSISMGVCNLPAEAERGIYKITNFDMRLYKRLKMFVHAEERSNVKIQPGEMTAYIRLGNDFSRDYYEYEIPLTMSDLAKLPASEITQDYAEEVWLKSNRFDIDLAALTALKVERNHRSVSANYPFTLVSANGRDSIRVKGNPNLGAVKTIMLGIRNRSQSGMPMCAEVWVNELRLNGFDNHGGVAGLARLDLKAADLGRATLSGSYTGIGYGGLEQRLQQRSREEILQYDITTNVELGKFFPAKAGIKIPMTYQYSTNIKTPEYDPYDLDVRLKAKLSDSDPTKRDSLKEQAVTANRISNLSFDNVRVERKDDGTKKPMPWNLSNFSLSYQQTKDQYSDPIISSETKTIRRGQLDYNYALPNGLNITPFKKIIKKDKYLKLLSEFNFSPLPSVFNFNTNIERRFNTTKYRFTGDFDSLSTFYNKRFLWDRKYTMNWDLSKGIKLNYNSDAASVIDEPAGRIDNQQKQDSVWRNIRNLGRYKSFNQTVGLNYTLPFKQIPFMDWISVKAQAQATYNWNAAALNTQFLGNTIRNTQNRQINGDFNFEQLYNQWKYLKKINTPLVAKPKKPKKSSTNPAAPTGRDGAVGTVPPTEGNRDRKETDAASSDDPRARLREKMKQGRATEAAEAAKAGGDKPVADKTKSTGVDSSAVKGKKKKKEKEEKEYEPSMAERILIRPLMMVRKGRFSYTENYQNTVPGFMPSTGILGQNNFTSPGWDFVLGATPTDQWLDNAAQKNWISKSNLLNESVVRNYTQQMQANVTIEPFTDFRVEVDAMKNYTQNHTQDFKKRYDNDPFAHLAPRDVGSFTVSYFSMAGLFGKDTFVTQRLYENFDADAKIISSRLAGPNAKPHAKDAGYFAGYGRANSEVAIPAFIAAYSGRDVNTVGLNIFNTMPLPNYKLTYNGLSKLKMFKNKVQSISITHGYKSQLQMNAYNTNTPDYDPTNTLRKNPVTLSYYTALNIPGVIMNKEFSPLIGVDMKLKNDLSIRVDMKKRYGLQMSFIDNMLQEMKQDEYTLGFGYKMKNVHLAFLDFLNFEQPQSKKKDGEKKNSIIKFKDDEKKEEPVELDKNGKPKKKKKVKKGNDLNLKIDFSLNNSATYQTELLTGLRQVTRGDLTIRFSPSADYTVNKRMTLRFMIDYTQTTPKTTASFPNNRFAAQTMIRFQL
jgi:cell surface protein SprA